MHIKCPHCQNAIEVVGVFEPSDVECPSCGSHFQLASVETQSYQQDEHRLLGRFELLERVGSGHFGDVWRARDMRLDRTVALKLPRRGQLDGTALAAFEREARAAAQVQHPNLVSVHEVSVVGPDVYIVSDYVAGFSLAEWLLAHRPSHRLAARWCAAIADGLHAAHEAGVVHRDLKPANVMLADRERSGSSSGGSGSNIRVSNSSSVSTISSGRSSDEDDRFTPKITDFGLAKREAGEITITVDGKILGTPAYMSPEQARGEGHSADRRSDVYSLGVVLYEMLAGERPFKGQTRLLLDQVLHEDPPPLRKRDRTIPRDLETICHHAMAKAPERRYSTAAALAADLRAFLDGRAISVRAPSIIERSSRWMRRNRAAAAIAALAVLAVILGGIAAYAWRRSDPLAIVPSSPTARRVRIASEPGGATITLISLNSKWEDPVFSEGEEGAPLPAAKGETTIEADIEPGKYLVVAEWPDGTFHEVFRQVPRKGDTPRTDFRHLSSQTSDDGTVVLPAIRQPPAIAAGEMAPFDGTHSFDVGDTSPGSPPVHARSIAPFSLDRQEVTVANYRDVMGGLPASLSKVLDENAPVTSVSYHEAVAYCERAGKRLMDEFEYEFAATGGGVRPFPWGDAANQMAAWPLGPAGTPAFDVTPDDAAVRGLYSNVAEWTSSLPRIYPPVGDGELPLPDILWQTRVVRGAPMSVADGKFDGTGAVGPRQRESRLTEVGGPGLGFRGARSVKPRTSPNDFGRALPVKAE